MPDRRARLDTRGAVDRAPPVRHRLAADACPRPVIPVEQALIDGHFQAGSFGDRLGGLPCPHQRARENGGQSPGPQRGPQPLSLAAPSLI